MDTKGQRRKKNQEHFIAPLPNRLGVPQSQKKVKLYHMHPISHPTNYQRSELIEIMLMQREYLID